MLKIWRSAFSVITVCEDSKRRNDVYDSLLTRPNFNRCWIKFASSFIGSIKVFSTILFLGFKSHKVYASVRKDKYEEEALTGRVFNKVFKDKTIQEQLISC